MDTLESIRSKSNGAKDLKSVVSALKAMASSNIKQYEDAVASLSDYYHAISLGIIAYFRAEKVQSIIEKKTKKNTKDQILCALVFGTDQGLVGQFNDAMAEFVQKSLNELPGKKEVWVIGERVQLLLSDMGLVSKQNYSIPIDVNGITPLVQEILIKSEGSYQKQKKTVLIKSYALMN